MRKPNAIQPAGAGRRLTDTLISLSGYIAFVLVALFFAIRSPAFLKPANISNILLQSSVLGIVSFGLTAIFIGGGDDVIRGGTDLSIANNMAFCAAVMAVVLQKGLPLWLTLVIGLGVSMLIGLVNAIAVVKLKMIPLLSTLAVMYILQGLEKIVTSNVVTPVTNEFILGLSGATFLGIPVVTWCFVLVGVVMYLVFNKSRYGNWVSAVGGNANAARASGVPVDRVVASTYVIAAIPAAISAFLLLVRLSSYSPGTGDLMLFDIMLISYLGAVFSGQYRPNIWGTFMAALFIGVLSNGFTMIFVPSYWVYGIKGALIILTVSITTLRKRKVM